jgi:hypothetical protein
MLTTPVVGLVTKAIMVKVTTESVVLLVNLVKKFTVAISVKRLLVNIRKCSCEVCARFVRFELKLKFVDKFY